MREKAKEDTAKAAGEVAWGGTVLAPTGAKLPLPAFSSSGVVEILQASLLNSEVCQTLRVLYALWVARYLPWGPR